MNNLVIIGHPDKKSFCHNGIFNTINNTLSKYDHQNLKKIDLYDDKLHRDKKDLVKKYNLGINQWMGLDTTFIDKQNIYKDLLDPVGSLSRCIVREEQFEFDYEKIHIVKDSNLKIFEETIDNIFK